jgi:Tfp pilus assembly protein PilN
MIRVNLLASAPGGTPAKEWLPREQRSAAAGLLLLLACAAGVGGYWWYLHQQRRTVDAKIAVAQGEMDRLKNVASLVDQATARRAELTERLSLIDRLRSTMRGPVSLLETVSRSTPDGLWLLDLKQQGATTQIEGRATSLTAVTDFTEKLQDSGLFKMPVEIVTTTTEQVDQISVVRFIVRAQSAQADVTDATTASKTPAPKAARAAKPGA